MLIVQEEVTARPQFDAQLPFGITFPLQQDTKTEAGRKRGSEKRTGRSYSGPRSLHVLVHLLVDAYLFWPEPVQKGFSGRSEFKPPPPTSRGGAMFTSYRVPSPISLPRRRCSRRRGRGRVAEPVASEAFHPRRKGTGVLKPKPFPDRV